MFADRLIIFQCDFSNLSGYWIFPLPEQPLFFGFDPKMFLHIPFCKPLNPQFLGKSHELANLVLGHLGPSLLHCKLQRKLRRDWRTVDSVPLKKITALLDSSPSQRFCCWRMYVLPRCQCDQGSSCHHWTPGSHLRTPLCYSQTSLGMLLWSLPSWYGTCRSMAMTFMYKTDFSNKCASIYMDFKRTLHDL